MVNSFKSYIWKKQTTSTDCNVCIYWYNKSDPKSIQSQAIQSKVVDHIQIAYTLKITQNVTDVTDLQAFELFEAF